MGKRDVKTLVFWQGDDSMAPSAYEDATDEYVATENIQVIGASFIGTRCSGSRLQALVSRSGMWKEPNTYGVGRLDSDDQTMFRYVYLVAEDDIFTAEGNAWQMLPDGCEFEVEKGERIYMHSRLQNIHASGTYGMAITVLVFYYVK